MLCVLGSAWYKQGDGFGDFCIGAGIFCHLLIENKRWKAILMTSQHGNTHEDNLKKYIHMGRQRNKLRNLVNYVRLPVV
jgi:hypothetical protein